MPGRKRDPASYGRAYHRPKLEIGREETERGSAGGGNEDATINDPANYRSLSHHTGGPVCGRVRGSGDGLLGLRDGLGHGPPLHGGGVLHSGGVRHRGPQEERYSAPRMGEGEVRGKNILFGYTFLHVHAEWEKWR